MRKSGDWSYVGFPADFGNNRGGDSHSSTPLKRPSPISEDPHSPSTAYRQPGSLLETKVIASIMQNETGGGSKSAQSSPVKPPQGFGNSHSNRCNSAMETLDRKPDLGNGPLTSSSPSQSSGMSRKRIGGQAGGNGGGAEYSMLQPRSLLLQHEQPHSSFYMNPMSEDYMVAQPPPTTHDRRSQSQTREKVSSPSPAPTSRNPARRQQKGLGKRSATQMEISRKSQWVEDEDEAAGGNGRGKWKSTEHLNEVRISENGSLLSFKSRSQSLGMDFLSRVLLRFMSLY